MLFLFPEHSVPLGAHSPVLGTCAVTLLRPLAASGTVSSAVTCLTIRLPRVSGVSRPAVWPGPWRPSGAEITVSGRVLCVRNQEAERTPSRLPGRGRRAPATAVRGSGDAEEGGSKETAQVHEANRIPWRRWEERGESGGSKWDRGRDAAPAGNPS